MNCIINRVTIIVLLLFCGVQLWAQTGSLAPGAGKIIYVDKAVATSGNGSSWGKAVKELADALKWAHENKASGLWSEKEPLKIYVAKGTYKPMYTPEDGKNFSATPDDNRDKTFLMVKDVELYGGFDPATGKTALKDRILPGKAGANPNGTILSGDLSGNDAPNIPVAELSDHASRQDNAYHVVMATDGVGKVEVKLDGFTITGGNAKIMLIINMEVNGVSVQRNSGAGIYASYPVSSTSDPSSCSVSLTNSSVNNNSSSDDGGGIYANSDSYSAFSSVSLTNSSINNNTSGRNGGGIYSNSSMSSTVSLINSSVDSNSGGDGGGIHSYSFKYSSVSLSNSSVDNNSGGDGGGIYSKSTNSSSSSSVSLSNSSVDNNTSVHSGGGIYSFAGASSAPSTVSLMNSSVNNNTSGSDGGGIYSYSYDSSFIGLTNSTVTNNNSVGSGGGIYSHSPYNPSSPVRLTNSSVTDNTSGGDGGGIYSYTTSISSSDYYSVMSTNSSVDNNRSDGNGGGIYAYSKSSSSLWLTNSSVTNNSSAGDGGGLYAYANGSSVISLLNSNLIDNKGNKTIFYNLGRNNKLSIHNSIIHENKDQNDNLYTTKDWLGANEIFAIPTDADLTYKYSLVQGDPDTENGNLIGVDPKFVDADNGDYSLQAGSPLINKGNDDLYKGTDLNLHTDKDLAGNPRLSGCKIDIGPYENQSNQGELCLTPGLGNIIYVDQAATTGGNGSSWDSAVKELADALKWAHENKASGLWSKTNPLKIYVAKGTYKPLYTPEDGKDFSGDAQYARDRTFLMVKDVELYGGFDPANRVTELGHARILPGKDGANPDGTVLSGDLDGNDESDISLADLLDHASRQDNAHHVVVVAHDTEGTTVKLDGFTITGGNGTKGSTIRVNGEIIYRAYGGAIFSSFSSPDAPSSSSITLTNSSVTHNSSHNDGGGIYSYSRSSSSSVTLTNTSVTNNSSTGDGGGICSYSTASSNPNFSSVTLTNSSVTNNRGGEGGGIYSFSLSFCSVTLTNSSVNSNSAKSFGGGIYCSANSRPSSVTLTNSSVANNSSSKDGGGIYSVSSTGSSSITLTNSSVANNSSSDGDGGGIYSHSANSSVTLTNSSVRNSSSKGNGGGIYSSAHNGHSSVKLINSSVINNSGTGYGGGIYSYSSSSSAHYYSYIGLLNSSLIGNKGNRAIYFYREGEDKLTRNNSIIEVHNSIIHANKDESNILYDTKNWLGNDKEEAIPSATNLVYKHSLVQGDPDSDPSNRNLLGIDDPKLEEDANGDYRLKAGSPLINAGDNDLYTEAELNLEDDKDLAGNPRLFGPSIDIGPYEFPQEVAQEITVRPLKKTYGDTAFEPGATVDSDEPLTYSSSDVTVAETYQDAADNNKWKVRIKKAGTVTLTASQAGGRGYLPAQEDFDLLIEPKPVTVQIAPSAVVQKIYDGSTQGSIQPAQLDFEAGDILGSDEVRITLKSKVLSYDTKEVGTAKTVTLPVENLNLEGKGSGNYRIGNAGALTANIGTIEAVPLTITAVDASKVYDGIVYAGGNGVKYHGFIIGESETDLSGSLDYEGDAQGATEVGEYTILPKGLTSVNYTITYELGKLTIKKAILPAFTFASETFTYDGTIKSLEATGLPAGPTVSSYVGNNQTNAGEYTVTANIDGGNNYEDGSQTAKLIIEKATQTIHFATLDILSRDAGTVALDVRSDSGLPVSLTVDDPSIATVSGTDLQVHRLGTVRITATQNGDHNHEAAAPVRVSVRVQAGAESKLPVRVHPALSPNGDGVNDFLTIEGIRDYTENKVTIFDKTGSVLAEIDGYNNRDRVFTGADQRDGTYFYYIDVKDNGVWKREKGYFVIRR